MCVFCGRGRDNIDHFIGECEYTKDWFKELGRNKEERTKKIWKNDLNKEKTEIVMKLWKKKERRKKERRLRPLDCDLGCEEETSQ